MAKATCTVKKKTGAAAVFGPLIAVLRCSDVYYEATITDGKRTVRETDRDAAAKAEAKAWAAWKRH